MDDIHEETDYTDATYKPLQAMVDPVQYKKEEIARSLNAQQTLNLQTPGVNPVVMTQSALHNLPITPKAQIFKEYNKKIPLNELGLPEFIYRADLVPSTLYDLPPNEQRDHIDIATMELDYSQGYPSLPDGSPIWAILPGEPHAEYKLFQTYLELPTTKVDAMKTPVRVLQLMAVNIGKPTEQLLSASHCYYWVQRAMAYDLFNVARHNKLKEQRLMQIEDAHFTKAANYLEAVEGILDTMLLDHEKYEMSPKEAMDFFFKLVQLQRLSVGANPNGQHARQGDSKLPENAPLEVILRSITKNAGMGAKAVESDDITKQLLADPKALEMAQELIIRTNTTNKSSKFGNMSEANLHME